MRTDRVYFPGLNGLRFLAAVSVILFHLEQLKDEVGLPNLGNLPLLVNMGKKGVGLFFVLSGFLITYLLLVEIKKTGTINVERFYIRRILRIWPLYYLIALWAFFVFPNLFDVSFVNRLTSANFLSQLTLFALMLPNVAKLFLPMVAGASQSWSVGVEEQFYLLWPLILRKGRNIVPQLLLGIVIVKPVVEVGLYFCTSAMHLPALNTVRNFSKIFAIEQMAFGGLGAWLLVEQKTAALRWLHHPATQNLNFGLLFAVLAFKLKIPFLLHHVDALAFTILIMNVAANPRSFIKLENALCNFMGNISYGLYMYHTTIIILALKYLPRFPDSLAVYNLIYYTIVISGTVLVAFLSHRYLELRFLKLKDSFSVIHSVTINPEEKTVHQTTVNV
jgi:peptidoglycan/LPS O-acetylase OafA/YrhL